jgi:hypothetical protein
MKYATDRPYSDPEKAARRLLEHAQAFEPVQDGRIYIEKINGPALRRNTAPAWSSLSRGAGMIRDLRKIHGWRLLFALKMAGRCRPNRRRNPH